MRRLDAEISQIRSVNCLQTFRKQHDKTGKAEGDEESKKQNMGKKGEVGTKD